MKKRRADKQHGSRGMEATVIGIAQINNLLGGPEARVSIWEAVEQRLLNEPKLADLWELEKANGDVPGYSLFTFAFNLDSIMQDVGAGQIDTPTTQEQWIEALVAEFMANFEACPAELGGAARPTIGRTLSSMARSIFSRK